VDEIVDPYIIKAYSCVSHHHIHPITRVQLLPVIVWLTITVLEQDVILLLWVQSGI
jgi:hypothetical protein